MKSKILLTLVALEMLIPIACDVNQPCGPFATKFDVKGYSVFFSTPYYGAPAIDTTLIYRYDSVAVRMYPLTELLYSSYSKVAGSSYSAIACSPPIPYSIDSVSNLTVVSDFDYDSSYSAGDTLNSIIIINFGFLVMPLNQFVGEHPAVKSDAFLQLVQPPGQERAVRLTIHIKHQNGEQFVLKTKSITLRP